MIFIHNCTTTIKASILDYKCEDYARGTKKNEENQGVFCFLLFSTFFLRTKLLKQSNFFFFEENENYYYGSEPK